MKYVYCFIVVALMSLFVSVSALAEGEVNDTGTAGMSFLKISPSARITALGGASAAFSTGASSIWSNPALISYEKTRTFEFSHIEWLEGIKQEYAAFTTRTWLGSFGLGVQVFDSDDIELRGMYPSSHPEGTYSIKNASFSLTWARSFGYGISGGVTAKKLFEKISAETADGYAFDVGVTADMPLEGLRLAAAARNYGRMDELKNERTKLPSDVVLGFSFEGVAPSIEKPLVLVGDYVIPKYGDSGVRLGVELLPIERFFLRAGYRSDSDIENVSFGVGVILQMFRFDVAYTPMKEGFDNTFRFTLGITGF